MIEIDKKNQLGVGLIEVMVALLLLGVAILGFSALQTRAVQSTDESLMRTRALTILRGGAEAMRANASSIDSFKSALNQTSSAFSVNGKNITIKSCLYNKNKGSSVCDFKQMAARDALVVKKFASDNELDIKLLTCPTQASMKITRQCFIASWNDTASVFSNSKEVLVKGKKLLPCAKQDGSYNSGSSCFILEAY